MQENRIILKGINGYQSEGRAGTATIKPGMAIERQADGEYDPMVSAVAAALKGGLKVAIEDALQGRTIHDAYSLGDVVFMYNPLPGDHIGVLVKAGEDFAENANLVVEGGGSGLFVEAAGTEVKFQLKALEGTGGALAADTHIKCEVL